MPYNKKHFSRNVDAESGKNRVSNKKKKPAPIEESSSDEEYVISDVESEQEMPAKDDSVRKKKPSKGKRPARVADHGVTGQEESGSELADAKKTETGSKVAPHMMMLLAATYHLGFESIVRPAVSNYIPSSRSFFAMAYHMMGLVSENTYLQEMCPSFFSVAFYTYCGYLYFYQVLRAKDEVGLNQLTRAERRALRHLKNIGEPEAWPVPAPLIEFIRAFGYYKSSNTTFSYIVPTLPTFTNISRPAGNTTAVGYNNYSQVAGIQRVPPVSAYIEFLHNFGSRAASYDADQGWIPVRNVVLNPDNRFIGLSDSSATNGNSFQALAFSDAWNEPTEGEMRWGPIQAATKRQSIRRWGIPSPDTTTRQNIDDIEKFLCLQDGINTAWVRQLITQANVLTKFFPGSTTLAAIDPVSHIGNLTDITVDVDTPRVPLDNDWYRGRQGWNFNYFGYDDSEQGRILSRIGLATMTNAVFSDNVVPVGTLTSGRAGPFFVDDATNAGTERHEVFRTQGDTESDPAGRFSEQVSALFDPSAGKK